MPTHDLVGDRRPQKSDRRADPGIRRHQDAIEPQFFKCAGCRAATLAAIAVDMPGSRLADILLLIARLPAPSAPA